MTSVYQAGNDAKNEVQKVLSFWNYSIIRFVCNFKYFTFEYLEQKTLPTLQSLSGSVVLNCEIFLRKSQFDRFKCHWFQNATFINFFDFDKVLF